MITRDQVISIGTMAKPFGTKGQLICHLLDNRQQVVGDDCAFIILSLDNILVPFRVLDYDYRGEDIVFTFRDIDTEDKARMLCGNEAFILRSTISSDIEDEMLWTDFVGWQVKDIDQGFLGTITGIDDTTENILATLHHPTTDNRCSPHQSLIPLHEDFILSIDDENRVLTINLPFQVE